MKSDVQEAYDRYMAARVEVYGEEKAAKRPVTLMDIATAAAKVLKKRGYLKNLDESEEINACSIKVTVQVDGKPEEWLLMFRTRPTTTRPRSNPSAVRLPALAAPSVTRCPAVLMSIRQCA